MQTLDTIAAPAVTTTGTTTVNKYSPSYIMDVNTVFISFPTADMDVQQCAGDTRSGSGRTGHAQEPGQVGDVALIARVDGVDGRLRVLRRAKSRSWMT